MIFTPLGSTVNVAATTSTGNVELSAVGHLGGFEVRVYNAGQNLAFVNFGSSNAVTAATTTGIPLAPGVPEVFTVNPSVTHMAAITAAGSATVYATSGRGK